MIDLNFLATALNTIIGTDKYLIYVYTNEFPDDLGARNPVTMSVTRVPFGFDSAEMDAESMTITLTFELPTSPYGDDLVIRDIALEDIREKLLGRRRFKIVTPDGEYIVNSAFEQQPPSNPYTDGGRVVQPIVVNGTALIQSVDCLAIVGNDVKISINGEQLLKTNRVTSGAIAIDSNTPISEDTTLVQSVGISRAHTKNISFMYMGKDIENKFIRIAEGEPFDVNEIYNYTAEYKGADNKDIMISLPVKLTGVTLQDSLGTFLQYTLNLTVVKE